jgi:hypothetical protein
MGFLAYWALERTLCEPSFFNHLCGPGWQDRELVATGEAVPISYRVHCTGTFPRSPVHQLPKLVHASSHFRKQKFVHTYLWEKDGPWSPMPRAMTRTPVAMERPR